MARPEKITRVQAKVFPMPRPRPTGRDRWDRPRLIEWKFFMDVSNFGHIKLWPAEPLPGGVSHDIFIQVKPYRFGQLLRKGWDDAHDFKVLVQAGERHGRPVNIELAISRRATFWELLTPASFGHRIGIMVVPYVVQDALWVGYKGAGKGARK